MLARFQFIASFSSKTTVKYGVFDAPTSQRIVFYDVFATPKIEFLLKVSRTIVKHMLLDHPPEPVLAMNGKRVSTAPQNEHPDTSLESFSELLFVLSSMSFRRVLWAWVKGGTGLAPLGLALCWRILWLVLALCWAILAQSCDNLATRWSPRAPG